MSGPFGSQQWMYASGGFYDHPIDQSLRFNISDYPYLNRTPSSAGNRKTWTWSAWVKRGQLTLVQYMFAARQLSVNTPYSLLYFGSSDQLTYIDDAGTTLVSTPVYRDTSSWYHIVLSVDTTQATASNRYKFYVNGTQVTDFSTATYAAQNSDTAVNAAIEHDIGVAPNGIGNRVNHFDGYLAEINFVDGTALDPTSFGETKSGVWIPKKYSGSYGTNGFYFPFKNATIANETDAATITAPFGGTAANGKEPDGNKITSNTSAGSAFTLVHYDLGSAKNIQEYVIKGLSFTGGTSTFQLQYSTDNSSWSAATSFSVTATQQDFSGSLNASIRYWRIQATAFGVNGTASIDSLQLFSGDIGIDDSGNNNDFSSVHLLPSDIVVDSPTNNWCTLEPNAGTQFNTNDINYSEGNLKATNAAAASANATSTFVIPETGKYYFEFYVAARTNDMWVGSQDQNGFTGNGTGYRHDGGISFNGSTAVAGTYATYTAGDIIGVALDMDGNTATYYKNANLVASGTRGVSTKRYTTWIQLNGYNDIGTMNFGQDSSFAGQRAAQGNTDANGFGDFYYNPPSGYLALCSANLPDPVAAIDPNQDANPSDYFNTVLYTGVGTQQSITGVGFQPDWLWIKERSGSGDHQTVNAIRGATEILEFNNTDAELTTNNRVKSIDSDGFTVGGRAEVNNNTDTYVAWSWKMNGSGSANSDGSITTLQTSANQDLGMSMIHYRADGNSSGTVGTGLDSSKPIDMAIVKKRNGTSEYQVGHRFSGQGSNFAYHSEFNHTTVLSGVSPYFMGSQSSTNGSLLYLASGATSSTADRFFCWVFQSVEGFSKFGSYTGNASSDGPFVYTGFRPAFLIIKNVDSADQWFLNDNKRDSYNVVDEQILVNSSVAEATSRGIDFLSNGFKIRDNSTTPNGSGNTMIYMAFAEMPFKYANAR